MRFFIYSDWQKKQNIARIILLCIKVTLMVKYIPLRYYYNKYFVLDCDNTLDLRIFTKEINLVNRVLRNIPWQISCLMESLIIKDYLLKYKFKLPIFIGLRMTPGLEAHAWYCSKKQMGFQNLLQSYEKE